MRKANPIGKRLGGKLKRLAGACLASCSDEVKVFMTVSQLCWMAVCLA